MHLQYLYDEKMSWQRPEALPKITDLQNEDAYLNGEIDEERSRGGSPLSNHTAITGRSSKTDFLEKLHYFEAKGPIKNLSIKQTLSQVRAQFPKEDLDILVNRRLSPVKLNNNNFNFYNEIEQNRSIRVGKLEHDENQHSKALVTQLDNNFPSKPQTQKTEVVLRKRNSSGAKNAKVQETETTEPTKKLMVKKTIEDARARFSYEDINANNKINSATVDVDSDYLTSNCAKFFFTNDSHYLLNETDVAQKQFKLILKGHLYQNVFYSLEDFGHDARYYLHDFFDYDLPLTDLFDPYII